MEFIHFHCPVVSHCMNVLVYLPILTMMGSDVVSSFGLLWICCYVHPCTCTWLLLHIGAQFSWVYTWRRVCLYLMSVAYKKTAFQSDVSVYTPTTRAPQFHLLPTFCVLGLSNSSCSGFNDVSSINPFFMSIGCWISSFVKCLFKLPVQF